MDYLSPLDAGFLDAEDADKHASLAIASVVIVAGPADAQSGPWPSIQTRTGELGEGRQNPPAGLRPGRRRRRG